MIKLKDIKTPTTVEEFKENLKKYYFGYGKDALYVKTQIEGADGVTFDKINSLNDVYKETKTGFGGDGSSPCISPMISKQSFDKMMDITVKNMFDKTINEEDLFKQMGDIDVFDSTNDKERSSFMGNANPQWIGLDNQVLRLFFAKTLGEFSGYQTNGSWS